MNKIERLSSMLVKLQTRRFITAQQIADEFEISLRTVYRDLRVLEQSGVPVVAIPGVGYSLIEGYRLPPLMFTADEAISFLMAEKLLSQQSDESTYLIYKSGMNKIRAALKVSERDILEDFEENIGIVKSRNSLPAERLPHILAPLLKSIRERKIAAIEYFAGYTREMSFREIEPIGLYFMNNQWYLLAWCLLRNDYRSFKLTRIEKINQTDKSFSRNHLAMKTLLNKIYSADEVYHVSLKIEKAGLRMVGTNNYHKLLAEEEYEDYYIHHYKTSSLEIFARWFLSFADKAAIIEPPELNPTFPPPLGFC